MAASQMGEDGRRRRCPRKLGLSVRALWRAVERCRALVCRVPGPMAGIAAVRGHSRLLPLAALLALDRIVSDRAGVPRCPGTSGAAHMHRHGSPELRFSCPEAAPKRGRAGPPYIG